MKSQQRFLRRMKILDNIELVLRESIYFRSHRDDILYPKVIVWRWGQQEGRSETTIE